MTRPVTAIDTAWFQLERTTNRMVVHGVLFCDGPIDLAALRRRVRQRWVEVYPGFRQRPTWPTGPLGPAWWVDAPPDLDVHVTTTALPEPGDGRTLQRRIGELMAVPLPADRPWWRLEIVTGHADEGTAIHLAVHHGLADGLAFIHLFHALADAVDPDLAPPAAVADPAPAGWAHDLVTVAARVRDRAAQVVGALARLGERDGRVELGALVRATWTSGALLAAPPRDAATRLREHPGVVKGARWTRDVALDAVRDAGKAVGASMNDVMGAAIAGALREFLGPDTPRLRAVMPTNLRALDKPVSAELGNEFGLVLPPIPTDEPDPTRRIERMRDAMATVKRTGQALASYVGILATGLGPAGLSQGLVERYSRAASVIITNVPGPVETLHIDGARLRDLVCWVPCSGDIGLGVSVISYAGRVRLAVGADLGLVGGHEGLDRLVDALDTQLAALEEA